MGGDGLKRDRHRGGPPGPVVGASSTRVDVVYVLDAGLRQVTHLEGDLYPAVDVLQGCRPANPGVAALGKVHFHALVFLGPGACRKGHRQSRKHRDRQYCSAESSRSVHHPPSIPSTRRYAFAGDVAHAGTRTILTVLSGGTIPAQRTITASPLPKTDLLGRAGRLVVFAQQLVRPPQVSCGSTYEAVVRLEIRLSG